MKRRTLKMYAELFRNPLRLFGVGPDNTGASVILWPNGERAIWIQGSGGKGYEITASEGPAGLALHIRGFVGSPGITISGNALPDYEPIQGLPDARYIDLCQYNSDERSQRFKAWYQGQGEHPGKESAA